MLAIAGGKGGCGKTTTALGLAAAHARQGADTLVVDADCDMPDVHHRASVPHSPGVDAVADGAGLNEAVHRSPTTPGVWILPAGRRRNLETALRLVERWRGPVLVDCPAGTNPDATLPLRHADATLVVSTDQPQCLEDAETTREIARSVGAPAVGVIIRNIDTGSRDRIPPDWKLLTRVPSVDTPLASSRVREEWLSVSNTIIESGLTDTNLSRTQTGNGSVAGATIISGDIRGGIFNGG